VYIGFYIRLIDLFRSKQYELGLIIDEKSIAEMEEGLMINCWNGTGIDEKNIAEWKRDSL